MDVEYKVLALMTAPRYSNTWARNAIERALRGAFGGIHIAVSGGVFYGQCMQNMLEDAVAKGVELAITVDFDSIFNRTHVEKLIETLAANDHIDALAAMQCRRGADFPLCTQWNNTTIEYKGEPIECSTAHFGLTAIRLEKLKHVAKPWFWQQPNEVGEWNGDKTDDDIWFWKQWREAGNSIYVDPGNCIGHLEEMISIYDDNLKMHHIYPKDWDLSK